MLKLIKRIEDGWRSIGLVWHDQPWARKGIEFVLRTPSRMDSDYPAGRFVAEIVWGPGAGCIGGLTAFFAFRCKDMRGYRSRKHWGKHNMYVHVPFQAGITQMASVVPYPY